eukprot:scaffold106371_cov24-Tisochrysis_lutea.AAC.1
MQKQAYQGNKQGKELKECMSKAAHVPGPNSHCLRALEIALVNGQRIERPHPQFWDHHGKHNCASRKIPETRS